MSIYLPDSSKDCVVYLREVRRLHEISRKCVEQGGRYFCIMGDDNVQLERDDIVARPCALGSPSLDSDSHDRCASLLEFASSFPPRSALTWAEGVDPSPMFTRQG